MVGPITLVVIILVTIVVLVEELVIWGVGWAVAVVLGFAFIATRIIILLIIARISMVVLLPIRLLLFSRLRL